MSKASSTEPKKPHKTVSLILGSGGARGLAHIGVIQWLEEHDYDIQFISGSSMGALVGGMYAAGELDSFRRWFEKLSKTDILSLSDIAWERSGLIKGETLFKEFEKLIGNPNIEDLKVPFTAVATDIENEKEVWLQKGALLEAIRASIALPMIFTPVHDRDRVLIDGGVLNPIPIAPTFSQRNDLTIAVNLGGKPQNIDNAETSEVEQEKQSWLDSVGEYFNELKERFIPQEESSNAPFDWDMYDISNKAFDSMQSSLARQKIAAYPPDIVIEIPRDACGMLEFNQVKKMIDLGYQTAEKVLEQRPKL